MGSVWLSLLLAGGAGTAWAATDFSICSFDSDICSFNTDNGQPDAYYWTNNVGNPPGAFYEVVNWAAQTTPGWQDRKASWDVAWPGVDCPNYANVEFDVKIDQANSYPAADGTYGGVQVIFQGWSGWGLNTEQYGWSSIGTAGLLATNGWQHISLSLANWPHTLSRICLNFYGNPPSTTTNTICYFVDNIQLTTPPAPPPTMGIRMQPKPKAGLNMYASVAGSTYQRQSIRAHDNWYTWYNQPNPVTYSFTIDEFPTAGVTNVTQTFDTAPSNWSGWWGLTPTFAFDSATPDATGGCINGSLKVTVPFAGVSGEQTSFNGLFAAPQDGTKCDTMSFDIKVDPSSGVVTSGGNYGTFDGLGFVAPDWGQVTVGSYTIPLAATNWQHVTLTIPSTATKLNGIQGFWFKMWSDNTHTNPLSFWIDNVQLHGTPSSFQAHMYLVPGPCQTPNAPDWNETNCVFIQIQAAAGGNAAAEFRYKTNYPGSNGGTNIVGWVTNNCIGTALQDNYYSGCVLGTITNGPVVGTWSVTFNNNTNVTLTGPGATTNFVIPQPIFDALFANQDGTMQVYYGIDPDGNNSIGQRAIFSRARITSAAFLTTVDDSFSAGALDTNLWTMAADDANAVFVVPAGAKGWLSWTLPDAGFSLTAANEVTDQYAWATPAFHSFINNDRRMALMGAIMDGETTQFDVSGGTFPADFLIRESPTLVSPGSTSIRAVSGGNFQINSDFEIFTEISRDNGVTWEAPTNGPTHLVLSGVFATNTLPPASGQYVTPAGWLGKYASGVVLTNMVHHYFSDSFPAPDTTDPIYNFTSVVDVNISLDGGITFTSGTGAATVTMSVSGAPVSHRYFRLVKTVY